MPDKISDYPSALAVHGQDKLDKSNTNDGGSTYNQSESVTVDQLMNYINSNVENLYNADGSILVDRTITSDGTTTTWDGGNLALKSDGLLDNGLVLFDSLGAFRGGFAYDVGLDSGNLDLWNASGSYFLCSDGQLNVNGNDFYVEPSFVGVNNSVQIGTEIFRVNGESRLGNSIINGVGATIDGGGSTNARNFAIQNDADGKYFVATSDAGNGRIGINTLAPDTTKRLHVIGDVRFDGTQFLNNQSAPSTPTGGGIVYVESGALKYIGSSGTITTLANA